jgi:hypothetical protein
MSSPVADRYGWREHPRRGAGLQPHALPHRDGCSLLHGQKHIRPGSVQPSTLLKRCRLLFPLAFEDSLYSRILCIREFFAQLKAATHVDDQVLSFHAHLSLSLPLVDSRSWDTLGRDTNRSPAQWLHSQAKRLGRLRAESITACAWWRVETSMLLGAAQMGNAAQGSKTRSWLQGVVPTIISNMSKDDDDDDDCPVDMYSHLETQ